MTQEAQTQQAFSISLTEDQIILIKKVILLCQGQAQMHGYTGIRAEAEKAEAIFDQATEAEGLQSELGVERVQL